MHTVLPYTQSIYQRMLRPFTRCGGPTNCLTIKSVLSPVQDWYGAGHVPARNSPLIPTYPEEGGLDGLIVILGWSVYSRGIPVREASPAGPGGGVGSSGASV